jgi:uncharacterized protein (TIGR04255 family)
MKITKHRISCEWGNMGIDKIYTRPTVKQVIFQITFPNLFSLEGRIGSIQERIMNEFPESQLLQRKRIFIADVGPDFKIDPKETENVPANKIWRFESKNKTVLNITTNSLDLNSQSHKTYKLGTADDKKFRHAIEQVVGTFIEIAKLPIIHRIGLRYIDYCPLKSKNNATLKEWYNSKFPLDKFEIADAETMAFRTVVKKGDYKLGYVETLQEIEGENKLVLDFDGSATDIKASDYLAITDKLHDMISEAYEATIKQPVYDYMDEKEEA